MKAFFKPCCLGLMLALAVPAAALDLTQHAFFKHLIGEWEAEGELKGENDSIVTVTQTWTGRVDTEDTFSIEGSRTVNQDTQKFVWTYVNNPATGIMEATLSGGDGQPLRFEVSYSEVTQVMELKAITGNGTGSIMIEDALEAGDPAVLKSKVTFTGDQGQTTLQGVITHKRRKSA